ncbi:MAG TPA: NAD(P)H-hydrate epimerase [Propionibacteriaceae bacterium]|nr:NAD(P)H-hydrate epimerase [Propionibacteriaceae bacterium]
MRAYRVDKIRQIEERAIAVEGVDALMQRAAAAVAASAADLLRSQSGGRYGRHVMIMVGAGNNGGDALFAGVRLARRGVRVTAIRCLGTPHAAGLAALIAAGGHLVDLDDHDPTVAYDLVIDGILGIGGRPGLPNPVARLVRSVEARAIPTIAVDLPSGVDADTGAAPGAAVRATRTITFGELKPCHLLRPALSRCGAITVVDIGLGADHDETADLVGLDEEGLAAAWPYPTERSDKYARGAVGVDTGSNQYPGAAVMSVYGAVYGGAGYVRFLGAERPAATISAQLPNVVFSPGRVQAHLFGSGWGDRADGAEVLAHVAEQGLPAVVDADGLRYLPKPAPAGWLLTPHAGELARLLERERSWVEQDPVRAVAAGAEQTGATVLLKGATQLVAAPDSGPVLVAVPGPAWTAQAGSGDVLGGVCAALLAADVDAQRAGQLGASVQAVAAAEHPGVLAPQELARAIGQTLGRLEQRSRLR